MEQFSGSIQDKSWFLSARRLFWRVSRECLIK